MSCWMHTVGSPVKTTSTIRISFQGSLIDIPAGTVGRVEAIQEDKHILHLFISRLSATVPIAADLVQQAFVVDDDGEKLSE